MLAKSMRVLLSIQLWIKDEYGDDAGLLHLITAEMWPEDKLDGSGIGIFFCVGVRHGAGWTTGSCGSRVCSAIRPLGGIAVRWSTTTNKNKTTAKGAVLRSVRSSLSPQAVLQPAVALIYREGEKGEGPSLISEW